MRYHCSQMNKRKSQGEIHKEAAATKVARPANEEVESTDAEACRVCKRTDAEQTGLHWIMCDYCTKWLHRLCANLSIREFRVASKSNEPFKCYICVEEE